MAENVAAAAFDGLSPLSPTLRARAARDTHGTHAHHRSPRTLPAYRTGPTRLDAALCVRHHLRCCDAGWAAPRERAQVGISMLCVLLPLRSVFQD